MQKTQLVAEVYIHARHKLTGNVRHVRNGHEIGLPFLLRIVQYDGDAGYYLLRFDKNDEELTDTYHDTLEDAFLQAKFEYQIKERDWVRTGG
jgi:hypothetical protein